MRGHLPLARKNAEWQKTKTLADRGANKNWGAKMTLTEELDALLIAMLEQQGATQEQKDRYNILLTEIRQEREANVYLQGVKA